MDKNTDLIKNLLIELKNVSKHDPDTLMEKYDMLFIGQDFNKITSVEFAHYLQKEKGANFDHDYLIEVLPKLADSLSISLEPLIPLEDNNEFNQKTALYIIDLN